MDEYLAVILDKTHISIIYVIGFIELTDLFFLFLSEMLMCQFIIVRRSTQDRIERTCLPTYKILRANYIR